MAAIAVIGMTAMSRLLQVLTKPRLTIRTVPAQTEIVCKIRRRGLAPGCRLSTCSYQGVPSSGQQLEDKAAPENVKEEIILSDSCVKQLLHVTDGEPGSMLRVTVEGGGCSGFQYKFNLDNQLTPEDRVFERSGAQVVIDQLSLSLVKGSTIDYHCELIRSSFRVVDNPSAELGCSCGASFALKI